MGQMSLSVTDDGEHGAFPIGNNSRSLRWTIKNAEYGDKYIILFPYEKRSFSPYASVVYKTQTALDAKSSGELYLSDIIVSEDEDGQIQYSTYTDEIASMMDVDETWNSVWNASEMQDILYFPEAVSDLQYGSYGLGFVYESWANGDVDIEISSIAISKENPDVESFGKYDVYSGTSEATPVVSGAVGVIAASNPDLSAETLKDTLLKTARLNTAFEGKTVTGAILDFAEYKSPEIPGDNENGDTEPSGGNTGESKTSGGQNVIPAQEITSTDETAGGSPDDSTADEKTKFTWYGKKLTSKSIVKTDTSLARDKTPKNLR